MLALPPNPNPNPNPWAQAAFGEEVARPARDDHHAAGITKRALNHWCVANPKTISNPHPNPNPEPEPEPEP